MPVPSALQDILERCYRSFADVARPRAMDFSPYKSADIANRVLLLPCRELSDDDIGTYAGSAILTVGGPDDYRYFLPRVLELSVTNGNWIGSEAPIIAERLHRAEWTNWSSEQRASVRAFFDVTYDWSIDAPFDCVAPADLWLCGNLIIGGDAADLLGRWRHNRHPAAACRLANLRWSLAESLKGKERLPYWDGVTAHNWNAMVSWLLDSATGRQIEAALNEVLDEDRWQLELALQIIATDTLH